MDVAILAPALLNLSDVVKRANYIANGDRANVSVKVKADLEHQCFEIDVKLLLTTLEQIKTMFGIDPIEKAGEIAKYVGIGLGVGVGAKTVDGLLQLIKYLRGRKVLEVVEVESTDQKGNRIRIRVEGEDKPREFLKYVYDLYNHFETRKKAAGMLEPLRQEGYESLTVYKGDDVYAEFTKKDLPKPNLEDLPGDPSRTQAALDYHYQRSYPQGSLRGQFQMDTGLRRPRLRNDDRRFGMAGKVSERPGQRPTHQLP